jgi:hypothetical protein
MWAAGTDVVVAGWGVVRQDPWVAADVDTLSCSWHGSGRRPGAAATLAATSGSRAALDCKQAAVVPDVAWHCSCSGRAALACSV